MPAPVTILVKPHPDDYVRVAREFARALMTGEILVLRYSGEQRLSEHVDAVRRERKINALLLGSDLALTPSDIEELKTRLRTTVYRPGKYDKMRSFIAELHGQPQSVPIGCGQWGPGRNLILAAEARHTAIMSAVIAGLGLDETQFRTLPVADGSTLKELEREMGCHEPDAGGFVVAHQNAGSLNVNKYQRDDRRVWKDRDPLKALRKFYAYLNQGSVRVEASTSGPPGD